MFKIFKCNSRLLQDMVTIFLEGNVDSIANRWRHLINSSTSRLSICLKGSRAQEKQNTAHAVLYDNEWNFDPNNWKHLFLTFGLKDELSETLFQRENIALLREMVILDFRVGHLNEVSLIQYEEIQECS